MGHKVDFLTEFLFHTLEVLLLVYYRLVVKYLV